MKLAIFITLLALVSCEPTHPYKINGYVKLKNDSLAPAIWYTDTFQLAEDSTMFYYNSNGSKAVIYPPHKVFRIAK